MPRATTQKFTKLHQNSNTVSKKPHGSSSQQSGAGGGASNPIFNTDKLGQHILKVSLLVCVTPEKETISN